MPTRTLARPRIKRPAKQRGARITDAFYRRMTANPDARIPFTLTGK